MGDSGLPCDSPFVGLNSPPTCELTLTLYSLELYMIATMRLKSWCTPIRSITCCIKSH